MSTEKNDLLSSLKDYLDKWEERRGFITIVETSKIKIKELEKIVDLEKKLDELKLNLEKLNQKLDADPSEELVKEKIHTIQTVDDITKKLKNLYKKEHERCNLNKLKIENYQKSQNLYEELKTLKETIENLPLFMGKLKQTQQSLSETKTKWSQSFTLSYTLSEELRELDSEKKDIKNYLTKLRSDKKASEKLKLQENQLKKLLEEKIKIESEIAVNQGKIEVLDEIDQTISDLKQVNLEIKKLIFNYEENEENLKFFTKKRYDVRVKLEKNHQELVSLNNELEKLNKRKNRWFYILFKKIPFIKRIIHSISQDIEMKTKLKVEKQVQFRLLLDKSEKFDSNSNEVEKFVTNKNKANEENLKKYQEQKKELETKLEDANTKKDLFVETKENLKTKNDQAQLLLAQIIGKIETQQQIDKIIFSNDYNCRDFKNSDDILSFLTLEISTKSDKLDQLVKTSETKELEHQNIKVKLDKLEQAKVQLEATIKNLSGPHINDFKQEVEAEVKRLEEKSTLNDSSIKKINSITNLQPLTSIEISSSHTL